MSEHIDPDQCRQLANGMERASHRGAWVDFTIDANSDGWREFINKTIEYATSKFVASARRDILNNSEKRKDNGMMKVSYKGVCGELLKLECKEHVLIEGREYHIEIRDSKNGSRVCFDNVDMSEVIFEGAHVTFA